MTEDKKEEKYTIGELDKLKYVIVRDAKKEIRTWLGVYGAIVILLLGACGLLTYTGINIITRQTIQEVKNMINQQTIMILDSLKLQIYARIKKSYEETDIEKIVNTLIEKDANVLITERVKEALQPTLNDLDRDRIKYNELLILHELAINAESGDKISFIRLKGYLFSPNPEYQQFSKRITNKIQTKYYDISMYRTESTNEVDTIRKYLHCDSAFDRQLAINTLMSKNMYEFIPELIAMIDIEPDLEVEACIFRTLNRFLKIDIDLLDNNAIKEYTKKWNLMRNDLIKK